MTWPVAGSSRNNRPESPEQRLAANATLWLGDLLEDKEVAKQLKKLMEAVAAAAAGQQSKSHCEAQAADAPPASPKHMPATTPRRRRASVAAFFPSSSQASSAAGVTTANDGPGFPSEKLDADEREKTAYGQRGRYVYYFQIMYTVCTYT
jgi:hypothetical protein